MSFAVGADYSQLLYKIIFGWVGLVSFVLGLITKASSDGLDWLCVVCCGAYYSQLPYKTIFCCAGFVFCSRVYYSQLPYKNIFWWVGLASFVPDGKFIAVVVVAMLLINVYNFNSPTWIEITTDLAL